MATLIETLVQVLNEECEVYNKLVAISDEKTQIIVANDITKLQQITDQEQDVLTTIANLENKREEATNDIAMVLGKDTKGITLRDVIGFMQGQPDVQNQLSDVHDRLLSVVKHLSEINSHNSLLVNDQLEMIQFNLNLLQGLRQAPETGTYNKGAYNTGETYAPLHGYFDSKS